MTPFHDPLVLRTEDGYLGYSTDLSCPGVQTRFSADLLHWSEPFPLLQATPDSVRRHTGTDHFWAPEVIRRGNAWRLYCCASRFGVTQSVIGLAESDNPRGPFVYRGDVIGSCASETDTQPNAIDPCVLADREGRDWLVYGSFFGGIRILPLGEDGFPAGYDVGKCIAGGGHQAIEGGYCFYDAPRDRFVLFTSWGSLSRDYHIRVGFAGQIDGPYLDSQGVELTDRDPIHVPGDMLAAGCCFDLPDLPGFMAPGHNSLLWDGDAVYVTHHQRPIGDVKHPHLALRRLFFGQDGQLLLWPLAYDGAPLVSAEHVPEKWRIVKLDKDNHGVTYGRCLTSEQCGFHRTADTASMTLYDRSWQGVVYRQGERTACTLGDGKGECLWCVEDNT